MKKESCFFSTASLSLAALMIAASQAASAQTLDIATYKNQVMQKDPETLAAQERQKGAEGSLGSADLITGVNLFANAGLLEDQRPTLNPSAQGEKTLVNSYSFGLQQQTELGLRWSLSQNVNHTELQGVDTNVVRTPKYYDTFPKIELNLSLWRNLFGKEVSGDVNQMRYQAQALKKQADIAWIQRQSLVEETFYRVLSLQESLAIQKESLARSERILNWTEGRVRRNLVDSSDLYQAQAAVASRKIDLINAENSLKEASRVFNSLRGETGDRVSEKLLGSTLDLNRLALVRSEARIRKDTLAQKDLLKQAEAAYLAQKEKNKPTLDLSLQATTQGRDPDLGDAQSKTFKDKDYYFVGVNFVMPLDQFTASRSRRGFESLAKSQELLEKARERNERLTWEQTVDQAEALAKQVKLIRELETFQRKKADAERDRLDRGRSTTFQVLTFEQDYSLIRNQRIQIEFQTRQFINSLALFE